jgi:UDP-N-acetylmuramoyl-L-alanyl-D-glutamate--2,6-diaminopimelate ligase
VKLIEIISQIDLNLDASIAYLEINAIVTDSRNVQTGDFYISLPSLSKKNTFQFIQEAIQRGAKVILGLESQRSQVEGTGTFFLSHHHPRQCLAVIASHIYSKRPQTITAVTGTNGKTSVVNFARQIWHHLGCKALSIGTLGIEDNHRVLEKSLLTTPDSLGLHKKLEHLYKQGFTHLALEASSHGLSQHRLDGLKFQAVAFTNLSHDHLDFHETKNNYLDAKLRLFTELLSDKGIAVVNRSSSAYHKFVEAVKKRGQLILDYGSHPESFISLRNVEIYAQSQRLTIVIDGEKFSFVFPLVGAFQVMNALCALGIVIGCGGSRGKAVQALKSLKSVNGRLERVAHLSNGAQVFVDYAHTPDALQQVLKALRPHTKEKLSVVFGCGGERDRIKRSQMGKIAQDGAEQIIVTDDNPRGEAPDKIREEILISCPKAIEIADRRTAINEAIDQLGADDLLIVAGKGHEQVQIIGKEVCPFNDADIIRDAIARL